MDYCAHCGQTATIRCPIDGTFACKQHAANYPMYTLARLEHIQDPTAAAAIVPRTEVSVQRADGSTWTVPGNERIDICADCIDRTIAGLVPQFATVLMHRHNGSRERATVGFIETGLEWQDLNQSYLSYHSKIFGDRVIRAMGNPIPPWLRLSAQHTLAAMYADLAGRREVKPRAVAHSVQDVPAPRWFDKNRTEPRSVPSAYAWAVEYVYDSEWGRKTNAYIRADGDLLASDRDDKKVAAWSRDIGGPAAEPPAAHWPASNKELVKALIAEVKSLLS